MVRIGFDNLAQTDGFQKLFGVFLQMQGNARAARGIGLCTDGEGAFAVAAPHPALGVAGLARDHVDFVGHHEGRIKAHAELADQVDIFFAASLATVSDRLQEFGGA